MVDAEPLPVHDSVLGIDVGLESFAVTSDGEITRQPTLLSEGTKAIAPKATSWVSLIQGSSGWRKACRLTAKLHRHVFPINAMIFNTNYPVNW